MAARATITVDQDRKALTLALLSVVMSSLAPLGIAVGNGAGSPFLFAAAIKFGTFLAHGAFLAVTFRHVLADRQVRERVLGRVMTWTMAFMIVQQFDWALFTLASRFVDIAVVVVVTGTTTTINVFLLSRLFPHYQRIGTNAGLLLIGLLGLWFAASSDTGRLLGFGGFLSPGTPIGVLLAFLSAGAAAMTAVGMRWGVRLFRVLPADKSAGLGDRLFEVCCVMTGQSIANLTGGALQASIGFAIGESIAPESLAVAVATGALVVAGRTPRRVANLTTTNLGINAVLYAVPIVSLVWLLLFDQTEILRLDYLVIGAVGVVITTLLTNFEAEIRFGFKALMLALWVCGTMVYLRDDLILLEPFPIGDLEWSGGTYLNALALSATVFTLLLSFRTSRLAARTQDEDDRVFALFAKVDLLARRNLIDGDVRRHLLDVDGAHDPEELLSAYRRAQACLAKPTKDGDIGPENEERLAEAESQLNIIVHSRRHGVELGELFALMVFGGISVLLAIGARPASFGWIGFLVEVFSALFSAVIIFLIVHVWDVQGDRTSRVVEKLPDSDRYGVAFRDVKNRRFEQGTSIVVGFGIILTYLVLLWYKWLPAGGAM
jgi:hypothetical protein